MVCPEDLYWRNAGIWMKDSGKLVQREREREAEQYEAFSKFKRHIIR